MNRSQDEHQCHVALEMGNVIPKWKSRALSGTEGYLPLPDAPGEDTPVQATAGTSPGTMGPLWLLILNRDTEKQVEI